MKPKYKLGTLIQYKNEIGENLHGVVSAVVTKAEGYSYRVSEGDGWDIPEADVLNGYRPLVARKPGQKRNSRSSKRASKSQAVVTQ